MSKSPSIRLNVAVRGQPPSRFVFPRAEITIGRHRRNDLVLDHSSVSNEHARLTLNDGRLLLADLGSTSGTMLNDRVVKQAVLDEADWIRIGAYDLEAL